MSLKRFIEIFNIRDKLFSVGKEFKIMLFFSPSPQKSTS